MAVCLIGLICFLAVAVVPNQRELSSLDDRIEHLSLELRKQEVLSPVFKKLYTQFKQRRKEPFPEVKKQPLPQQDIPDITRMLQDAASLSGLRFVAAAPDVNTLKKNSESMRVKFLVEGSFLKLQDLLVQLDTIPYIDRIDGITIESGGVTTTFRLITWFRVEG